MVAVRGIPWNTNVLWTGGARCIGIKSCMCAVSDCKLLSDSLNGLEYC
jgi:hypothetical protein